MPGGTLGIYSDGRRVSVGVFGARPTTMPLLKMWNS
jgi:hypothetical protein